MINKKWTQIQLIDAVKNSYSTREVLVKLGLSPNGGNYPYINNYINLLKLNTEHFIGK